MEFRVEAEHEVTPWSVYAGPPESSSCTGSLESLSFPLLA